ncbi:MAG: NAD(P)H-hydrate dehydratase [Microcoleus sp. PH2017_10_PVI_O_A]|uniref:NAD(P)H-hydrate dehydratase n=1 Tax=unclassified Microcoleus TaxID=2642155 RepID=UPI001D6CBAF6|nr:MULTISPECIES: NAD(P)H-hydrate dehydratase [unclassified Microcoleus]TAE78358.1 MAG: NAD(P)H-hydrate dehydratase [Oscillatoriales cyanobacterium]MCC3406007.1 NAD(P)H-hydrate dehydratase [Microcoleus sp. PH2017_10_PVI_O_A]MCC3460036.1 NAD(P)H-hydrate dehydratase [Microcoleus sp. PH2017_11_PCY_U_A]MCC3478536.1 NAD(P)H-hydrate dehydratase [Microcoleus sp. PH2017_12_PCY_D_A]MCC3530169.1 NAD(P)H-hydrate dehydratase [Microcoleus sp. PH2017_21_RUC_O_A]
MTIQKFVVTADQMRQIETRIFAAGMPVAALMEKVAGLIARRIQEILKSEGSSATDFDTDVTDFKYRRKRGEGAKIVDSHLPVIGVLVGPGHNGGDALVVARELHFQGFSVVIYCPFSQLKELTKSHADYARSLNIPFVEKVESLNNCDLLIDGLFGFGLEREITNQTAAAIDEINNLNIPIFSIDIPSGIHTDTGSVLGTAIRAKYTLCLGLWKRAFLQDQALEYIGKSELIDFDIPLADIAAILGEFPAIQRITKAAAIQHLPLPRSPISHKYTNGNILIIAGSGRYSGASILAALGARASGVGMLSIAVPESIKPMLSSHLPEALVIGCPETQSGAIRELPVAINLSAYDAIAAGPGLTLEAAIAVESVLECDRPLVLDADGLNILAQLGTVPILSERSALTIITPHPGEFKRLFPKLADATGDRIAATQAAAQLCGATVLLKGARVCISWKDEGDSPADSYASRTVTYLNPESTPALARGGSGDVLTGLLGGLLASAIARKSPTQSVAATAAWWHAKAGIAAAKERTELGVDAFTLTQYLIPTLRELQ